MGSWSYWYAINEQIEQRNYYVSLIFFNKYAWVIPLKDRNPFQSILNNSKRKPNKIWVDQGSEFYNKSFKKWLEDNNIEMYSRCNEKKYGVAERVIRFLKNKIYKHMKAVSKNVYSDVLNNILDKYNNAIITLLKWSLSMLNLILMLSEMLNSNDKDAIFKIGYHLRISKYKSIFAKGYSSNWSEEVFEIRKIKNTVPRTYVINNLNGEEILVTFYEKEL